MFWTALSHFSILSLLGIFSGVGNVEPQWTLLIVLFCQLLGLNESRESFFAIDDIQVMLFVISGLEEKGLTIVNHDDWNIVK